MTLVEVVGLIVVVNVTVPVVGPSVVVMTGVKAVGFVAVVDVNNMMLVEVVVLIVLIEKVHMVFKEMLLD